MATTPGPAACCRLACQVRVWTADDVLRELTSLYEKLPGEIQAELPLKRIWALAEED